MEPINVKNKMLKNDLISMSRRKSTKSKFFNRTASSAGDLITGCTDNYIYAKKRILPAKGCDFIKLLFNCREISEGSASTFFSLPSLLRMDTLKVKNGQLISKLYSVLRYKVYECLTSC